MRHRWVVALLALQAAGLPLFTLLRGYSLVHRLQEALIPAAMAALACWPRLGPRVRSASAGTGLMVVSGILVHLSGGAIEAHFLFFVMIPIVALYESWWPFGVAIGYVLIQHGIVGTLDSSAVYNHQAAREHPWTWAGVHAGLFAAACAGAMVNWKLHERARAEAVELTHHAHHDELTGLPNRTLFKNRCGLALNAARSSEAWPTVLLLDLDGFKDVNDTLGHHRGDLLLVEVAQRLQASVRAGDTVCRLGGDEFAILLAPSVPASGEQAAQRITHTLTAPFLLDGTRVDVEVSIGIATAEPGEDVLTVLRHADAAMYAAKEHRLGYTRHVPGQEGETTARFQLLGALRHALDHDEIVLHYQPKIAIDDGQVVGIEALARWQHPTRGLLSPAAFLPVLENTTLSHRFTSHVLSTALAQTRRWNDRGISLPVAVNVSSRCLLDPGFPDTVGQQLLAAGVPGTLLCIELTENTIMTDPERAVTVLERIRALGVRVAIDDFRTGYSSMAYLQVLPLDELKVDQSFVRDLATDRGNTALVQSAVDLGHSLGLVVVAEGVEDATVLDSLRRLGCDIAQGYQFARPLPPDEFVGWYQSSRVGAAQRLQNLPHTQSRSRPTP